MSQKLFSHIVVCRAFLADHFGKKKYPTWPINDWVKVKILKHVKQLLLLDFFSILTVAPSFFDEIRFFFCQNDQQKELYKLRYMKKISDSFASS
jgi:hypothetical protein